jgi:uncharacterized integral membrane protein
MPYEYKRRRISFFRNLWVYRRLIGSAILLGIMIWFIWANDAAVTVAFPFKLGRLNSSLGIVILLSALVGSLVTMLIMTVVMATRWKRSTQSAEPPPVSTALPGDRPPPDYAAKAPEGFSNARWSQ